MSGNIKDELAALMSCVKGVNATVPGLALIANAQAHSWMQQVAQAAIGCNSLIFSGLAAFVGLSVGDQTASFHARKKMSQETGTATAVAEIETILRV